MPLAAPLLLGVIGLALLLWGWRGRRLDDHPVCRKCRYDLTGVYTRSDRCPECGATLTDGRRIRIGNRRKRLLMIVAGLAVILLAGGVVGVERWSTSRDFDWATIKPTWLLVRDAKIDGDKAFFAYRELAKRYQRDELSDDRIGQITVLALQRQGDSGMSRPYSVHEWLFAALKRDQLSDEQWKQYLCQAINLELKVRPVVRRGDRIPMEIAESIDRATSGYGSILGRWRILKFEIDDRSYKPPHSSKPALEAYVIEGAVSGSPLPGVRNPPDLLVEPGHDALPMLERGTHRVRLTLEVDGTRNPPGNHSYWRGAKYPRRSQLTSMRWQVVCESQFEVVGGSDETVEGLNENPSRSTLRVSRVDAGPSNRGGEVYVQVDFHSFWEPQCLAFDVILRNGDREWLCGGFAGEIRTDLHLLCVNYIAPTAWALLEGFDVQTVDVIVRPSRDRARQTIGITAILDEEIVFENVSVRWPNHEKPVPPQINELDVEAALQSTPSLRP